MIIGWILILIALAEFILGLYLIFRYQRSQATMWYGLFAIASAVYVGANGLGFVHAIIPGRWAEHLAWVGGISSALFFLPFSLTYPLPRRSLSELWPLVFWPFIILIPGLLFTNLFVRQQGIVRFGQGYTTAAGPFFWFMIVVFSVYWIWAIVNLVIRMRSSDGSHKYFLRLILTGVVSSLVVGSFFDIYMPLAYVTRYGYVGSLFTSVWLGFTSYIILK